MIKVTLNEFLDFRGKTKYWLSKQTGISQTALGEFANNKTVRVRYELLNKICTTLDCKLENIITYIKEDTLTK